MYKPEYTECFWIKASAKCINVFQGWKTFPDITQVFRGITAFMKSPDVFGCIDDLFDSRDSQSDVHGSDSSEVKRLEGHLSPRLPDALSTQSPDGRARLHLRPERHTNHIKTSSVSQQRLKKSSVPPAGHLVVTV